MKRLEISFVVVLLASAGGIGSVFAQAGGAPTGVGDAQQLNMPSTVGATRGGTPDAMPMSSPSAPQAAPAPADVPVSRDGKRARHKAG